MADSEVNDASTLVNGISLYREISKILAGNPTSSVMLAICGTIHDLKHDTVISNEELLKDLSEVLDMWEILIAEVTKHTKE